MAHALILLYVVIYNNCCNHNSQDYYNKTIGIIVRKILLSFLGISGGFSTQFVFSYFGI